jgi:1-acyl-sn-glycerol-3-phosphate acyltransferase
MRTSPSVAPLSVRRVLRVLVAAFIRVLYRIELRRGVIPDRGPCLVVANHTAYVDPFVLVALTRYPLRFVYWHGLDRIPLVGRFCRFSGGIPITSARENPAVFERAMQEIDEALKHEEVVVVFPEGGLTRDGELAPFKKGIERIVSARPTEVVPVAIEGLWGSIFSRRRPRRGRTLRPRLELAAGPAIAPHEVRSEGLREAVLALRASLS